MKKLLLSLTLSVLFCGTIFAQQRDWKEFSPKNKAWTILAPGEMKPDQEAQIADSKKGSYSYNDFAGFYAIAWRDSPKRLVPWKANRKKHYQKSRNEIVKAGNGKLLKELDFTNGEISGREAFVRVPFGTMTGIEGQQVQKYRIQRFRMFFVGDRFYLILAVLPESESETPETNRYFNSFRSE